LTFKLSTRLIEIFLLIVYVQNNIHHHVLILSIIPILIPNSWINVAL